MMMLPLFFSLLLILDGPIGDPPPPKPEVESIVSDRPVDYPMKIAVHPSRRIGTNQVDLTPLFAWMRFTWANDGRNGTPNPMPYWKPLAIQADQVKTWGIVGDVFVYARTPDGFEKMHKGTVVLVNWPIDGLSEGEIVKVLAVDIGPRKFRDISGEIRSLRVFDAGVVPPPSK